jgi:hypothetical protein
MEKDEDKLNAKKETMELELARF